MITTETKALPMSSLAEIMAEEDARRVAEARAEIAREQAEWAALSPTAQAAIIAAREAKWAAFQDAIDAQEAADPDEDEDQGEFEE